MNTNNIIKVAILVLVAVYIISPIDACPGPVDDILILLLGLAGRTALNRKNKSQRKGDEDDE